MKIVGLDPSLTAFGLARVDTSGVGAGCPLVRVATCHTGLLREHPRLDRLLGTLNSWVAGADVVLLEGLAFGAKGAAVTDLAGLHWLVRQGLWRLKLPYAIVDPKTRAKWITGNGSAAKDACLAAAIKRFGFVDIADNNQADALTMAAMGCAYYGEPLAVMPEDRAAVLTGLNRDGKPKILWPFLNSKGDLPA